MMTKEKITRDEQLGHDEKAKRALRGGFYKCLY